MLIGFEPRMLKISSLEVFDNWARKEVNENDIKESAGRF